MPPTREDPAKFMVKLGESLLQMEKENIPDVAEKIVGTLLERGYGLTAGAFYGALFPKRGGTLAEGTMLALGVWAIGYLGWFRAIDLMPPVSQHRPEQVAGPVLQHLAYGIVTAAVYHWLEEQSS
jgi:hypothetical protein